MANGYEKIDVKTTVIYSDHMSKEELCVVLNKALASALIDRDFDGGIGCFVPIEAGISDGELELAEAVVKQALREELSSDISN